MLITLIPLISLIFYVYTYFWNPFKPVNETKSCQLLEESIFFYLDIVHVTEQKVEVDYWKMEEVTEALPTFFYVCKKFKDVKDKCSAQQALDVGQSFLVEINASTKMQPALMNVKADLVVKIQEIQDHLSKQNIIKYYKSKIGNTADEIVQGSKEVNTPNSPKYIRLDPKSKLGIHQSSLQQFLSYIYIKNNQLIVDWKAINSCEYQIDCILVKKSLDQTNKTDDRIQAVIQAAKILLKSAEEVEEKELQNQPKIIVDVFRMVKQAFLAFLQKLEFMRKSEKTQFKTNLQNLSELLLTEVVKSAANIFSEIVALKENMVVVNEKQLENCHKDDHGCLYLKEKFIAYKKNALLVALCLHRRLDAILLEGLSSDAENLKKKIAGKIKELKNTENKN